MCIRDRSQAVSICTFVPVACNKERISAGVKFGSCAFKNATCLLYTSDAADERSSVDLGGRRIIKKKQNHVVEGGLLIRIN